MFYFPLQPVENSILGTYVPPRLVSSIFGMKFILTFGLGSLGAVFSGYIAETMSTATVYLLLAPFTAVSVLFALGAMRARNLSASYPSSSTKAAS
jgi:hypothetical protein